MEYFPCHYRLNAEDLYLIWIIWIADEKDSVVASEHGEFIPAFKELPPLRDYAERERYPLQNGERNPRFGFGEHLD
jgi:hypothetical protein